jgi:hypothetical protein
VSEKFPVDLLRQSVQNLIQQIHLSVQEWCESGQLVISRRGYVLRPSRSFIYSADVNPVHRFWTEHGEEEIWDRNNYERFFVRSIGELRLALQQPIHLQIEVDRLTRALRLFRLGAVSAPRIDISGSMYFTQKGRIGKKHRCPRFRMRGHLCLNSKRFLLCDLRLILHPLSKVVKGG